MTLFRSIRFRAKWKRMVVKLAAHFMKLTEKTYTRISRYLKYSSGNFYKSRALRSDFLFYLLKYFFLLIKKKQSSHVEAPITECWIGNVETFSLKMWKESQQMRKPTQSLRVWVQIRFVTLLSRSKTLNYNCFAPPRGPVRAEMVLVIDLAVIFVAQAV